MADDRQSVQWSDKGANDRAGRQDSVKMERLYGRRGIYFCGKQTESHTIPSRRSQESVEICNEMDLVLRNITSPSSGCIPPYAESPLRKQNIGPIEVMGLASTPRLKGELEGLCKSNCRRSTSEKTRFWKHADWVDELKRKNIRLQQEEILKEENRYRIHESSGTCRCIQMHRRRQSCIHEIYQRVCKQPG